MGEDVPAIGEPDGAQVAVAEPLRRLEDPTGVVELMASRSFIAALPIDENQAVREEVRQLLSSHPDTRGREQLRVPYRTDVYVAMRTGKP